MIFSNKVIKIVLLYPKSKTGIKQTSFSNQISRGGQTKKRGKQKIIEKELYLFFEGFSKHDRMDFLLPQEILIYAQKFSYLSYQDF
jgi:hypothetical protein